MHKSPYGWWLPLNASTQGTGIDALINVVHIFMAVLFVGWGLYLAYVLIRFRARPGHQATVSENAFRLPVALEIGVFIFEIALLVFISSPLWWKIRTEFPSEKEAFRVRVVGEQFAWNFHYPGRDGKFGRTSVDLADPSNPAGVDRKDPDGRDDIVTVNNLHIPVNTPVIAYLSSKDVIHNFFLPVLRVKQDVIPGMTIPVWFQAKLTGADFEVACAQLCGLGHYRMMGVLSIDTSEQFEAWMTQQIKEQL